MAFPATIDVYTNQVDNSDYVLAADINGVQGDGDSNGGLEAIEAKLGIDSSAVATSIDYLLKNAASVDPGHSHSLLTNIATAGNKIWIYQNVAWTGWTIVAVTDAVLAVKGGSQAYNVTGGQVVGTWTQPDHTLATSEIPAHTHQLGSNDSTAGDSATPNLREFIRDYGSGNGLACTSSSTGGGTAHNHGTTYRPAACVGIVIEKS